MAILGLCHVMAFSRTGLFFKHIIVHFSRENGISTPSMSAFEAEDIKKGETKCL